MNNIKDKLIEAIRSSGYGYFITHKEADVEECLQNTADSIIEKLPDILADSEWVTTPFKLDDEVWFVNKYKLKVYKGHIYEYTITRDSTDEPCYEISVDDDEGYDDDYGTSYDIFYNKAEAEARLIELKAEIKESENE